MNNRQAIQRGDRSPAIELYRILLMFLIVFSHTMGHGIWGNLKDPFLSVLQALIIWHVDGFLSITGWFGTKFSIGRFATLWGVITFYSLFSVAYGWWTDGKLSGLYLAGGWFGRTYLFFMFLAPLLNAASEFLSQDKRKLYLAWTVLDCGAFLNWAPYHLFSSVSGSGAGDYSVATFILVYMNVRMLKLSGLSEHISKYMLVGAAFLFLSAVLAFAELKVVLAIIVRGVDWGWTDFWQGIGWCSEYNAPHVILMAIAGLLFFVKFVHVPKVFANVITAISPLMFGVYIIHDTTTFGRLIYRIPQAWMANHLGWHPLVIVFLTTIGCFMLCTGIEASRRMIAKPFSRWIMPKIQAIDKRIGL